MQIDSKWLSNYTYAIYTVGESAVVCGSNTAGISVLAPWCCRELPRCCRHCRHASVNARSVTAGVRVDTVFHPPPSRASAAQYH